MHLSGIAGGPNRSLHSLKFNTNQQADYVSNWPYFVWYLKDWCVASNSHLTDRTHGYPRRPWTLVLKVAPTSVRAWLKSKLLQSSAYFCTSVCVEIFILSSISAWHLAGKRIHKAAVPLWIQLNGLSFVQYDRQATFPCSPWPRLWCSCNPQVLGMDPSSPHKPWSSVTRRWRLSRVCFPYPLTTEAERLPWFHTTSMCFRGWPISDEHLGQLIWGQLLQGCCDLLRGLALHCGLGFLEVLTWGELGASFQVPISRQWPCWG